MPARPATPTALLGPLFLLACETAGGDIAGPSSVPTGSAPVLADIRETDGPIGKYCSPTAAASSATGPTPALIVIGGSGGGLAFAEPAARHACDNGFAALALAYWGMDGLPAALEEIPLEYFDRAVAWVAARPDVDPSAIGLVGYSRGSEAALLTATRNDTVAAVAALVPGAHVGPSSDFFDLQSAWSVNGIPLPFVTTRPDRPGADWREVLKDRPPPSPERERTDFQTLLGLPEAAAAEIRVDQVGVPLVLVGAGQDAVWASADMTSFIVDRLTDAGASREVQATYFGAAAHDFMLDSLTQEGSEDTADGAGAWQAVFSFLHRHLSANGR